MQHLTKGLCQPNYRNWKPKILKEIINRCNDRAIVYFDNHTRHNMQDKSFAKVELNSQMKKGLTKSRK